MLYILIQQQKQHTATPPLLHTLFIENNFKWKIHYTFCWENRFFFIVYFFIIIFLLFIFVFYFFFLPSYCVDFILSAILYFSYFFFFILLIRANILVILVTKFCCVTLFLCARGERYWDKKMIQIRKKTEKYWKVKLESNFKYSKNWIKSFNFFFVCWHQIY